MHLTHKAIPGKAGLALASLALLGLAAAQPAAAQDQVILAYGTGTPSNSWAYSKNVGVGGDASYYPTSTDISQAVFQGYVTTPANGAWGGGNFFGDYTTFVFDTTVTSNIDQTLSLSLGGDDGHSAFVNGQFIGGGTFGGIVNINLTLKAGVPVNLQVADHNYGGPWVLGLTDQSGNPITASSGITLNGTPVPEASTTVSFGLLLCLGLGGLGWSARRKKAQVGE